MTAVGMTTGRLTSRLLLFALLVGFLTWVHPTGLPVAFAAIVTLALISGLDRKLTPALAEAGAVLVAQELQTGLNVYTRKLANVHDQDTYSRVFVQADPGGARFHGTRSVAANGTGDGRLATGAFEIS